MNTRAPVPVVLSILAAALGLASCQTVNKFDQYKVWNSTVAFDLQAVPAPSFKINYSVTLDSHNPLGTALSIGTNLVKANEAANAEGRMKDALSSVNIPDILLQETETACSSALGAQVSSDRFGADFTMALEIREYGLEADSPWQGVRLFMRVTARLVHNASGDLVWGRAFTVDQGASPEMFGMGSTAGNVVTAVSLSELSTDELARGFTELAQESARVIAHRMENDMY